MFTDLFLAKGTITDGEDKEPTVTKEVLSRDTLTGTLTTIKHSYK